MGVSAIDALACDSIRQENNGKYIAIGIYSGAVMVPSFPSIMAFQLFAKVKNDSIGRQELLFRILVDGKEDHQIVGELTAEIIQQDWVPIPLQPINFLVPSRLSVEQKDEDGTWREFFSINVARANMENL